MLNKVFSGTILGVDGLLIEVEVDVSNRGLPNLTIVGLASKSVEEAKERVRTSIKNSSFNFPNSRITINLAPADIQKEGCAFDLPIAVGILAGSGIVNPVSLFSCLFIGELSLTGELRSINGALLITELAKSKKINNIFLPIDNLIEASLVEGVNVFGIKNLNDLILHLNNQKLIKPYFREKKENDPPQFNQFDFAFIKGQQQSKRALEIAAAGFHNVRLSGQSGAGKTLLSRSLPSILPPMTREEFIEVARIYSSLGLINNQFFNNVRPFRSPHHTISRIGLIGGGSPPKPGEISLAHRGVLFLDEAFEFPRSVIECLRQPMEDGFVWIVRASGRLMFPSRFMLIIVSNPCPCGFLGHPKKTCNCSQGEISRYKKRLSGPLIDRIDIHVNVPPVENESLINDQCAESSQIIQARVIRARKIQQQRYSDLNVKTNAEIGVKEIKKYCYLSNPVRDLLKKAVDNFSLSARSYFKTIKVAQTIADLDSDGEIRFKHVAEALQFRERETE